MGNANAFPLPNLPLNSYMCITLSLTDKIILEYAGMYIFI